MEKRELMAACPFWSVVLDLPAIQGAIRKDCRARKAKEPAVFASWAIKSHDFAVDAAWAGQITGLTPGFRWARCGCGRRVRHTTRVWGHSESYRHRPGLCFPCLEKYLGQVHCDPPKTVLLAWHRLTTNLAPSEHHLGRRLSEYLASHRETDLTILGDLAPLE